MKRTKIRRALCAILAALSLSTCAFSGSASAFDWFGHSTVNLTPTSAATTLIPDSECYICLYHDISKGLNVQFASKTAGEATIVVDSLNSESNEIFIIRNHGDNVISIHPKHAPNLALNCLYGADAVKGQNLTLWNYEEGDQASLWQVLQNDDGSFCIKSLACGYVIDLNHANYEIGNNLLLWQQTGESSCQSFYFLPTSTSEVLIPNGTFYIALHDDSKKGINIQFASKEIDKATAVVDTLNGELNETFRVVNRGNGLISIHPLHCENERLCLNAQYGPAAEKGEKLILHNYEPGDLASLWLPIKKPDGSFSLKSAACSWVIDVNKGDYTNGNQILLWEKTDSNRIQSFFFVDVDLQNPNLTTNYAAYDGVNYRAQTSDSRRIAACDKAVQMATVLWTAPSTFVTWRSSKGAYNTVTSVDGTSGKQFIAGKTYQGIPYSMCDHSYDDIAWLKLMQSRPSASSMTGTYYKNYPNTTKYGMDCSYLVYTALKAGNKVSGFKYLNTSSMLKSSFYKKISLSSMLPGDVFLKNGHTMLYMGKTDSGRYAVIEANADYSRVVYNEYSKSQLNAYGCYRYAGF